MNLFAEIRYSLSSPASYAGFRKNRAGKTFLYGALLTVIYVLAVMILPLAFEVAGQEGIKNWVKNGIPEFVLEDGKLWTEEPMEYANMMVYLKVDTSCPVTQEISKSELLAFDQAVVIDAEHILAKAEGKTVTIPLSDLGISYMDREVLLQEAFPRLYGFLGGLVFLMFWFSGFLYFGGSLVTAFIGWGIAFVMRCRISFGDLYKLAIHAGTAALLLKMIYAFIPVIIPFFDLITLLVSAAYMKGALNALRAEEE